MDFERIDIDLANKPDWFLACSPLGKTPVLLIDDEPIFESAVICEYLDDTLAPRLHPEAPLARAKERSWIEFGSALLSTISAFYNAADETALARQAAQIRSQLEQVDAALKSGPFFAGGRFGLVDAVFGPVFRYFDLFDEVTEFRFFDGLQKTATWRAALAARPSVRGAVSPHYPQLLRGFVQKRGSALSARLESPLPLDR